MTINKQILHIVVEIIVISGVIIYFSYKHKKLVTRVEELSKQLEIQNEIIQKHEQIINQLIMSIQSAGSNKVNSQCYTGNDSNDAGCKPKKINKHKDSNVSKKITKQKILITKQKQEEEEEEEEQEQEEPQEEEEEYEVEKQILKNKPRSVNNVSFNKKPQIYEYTGDTSSDHDSELDTEIASELNELEEGLKKKN
jgi:hypothetical protein